MESLDLPTELQSILQDTDWSDLKTARGDASVIPELLLVLFSTDARAASKAAGELDDLLCHQHVMLADAALPATPIVLHALTLRDDAQVLEDLLFLLDGFAAACVAETWDLGEPAYLGEVCRQIEAQRSLIGSLSKHSNETVAETAEVLLEKLDQAAAKGMPEGAKPADR